MLEELIQKLQNEHGISAEQSHGVINSVTEFIKEKFPMVGGMLDNLLIHQSNSPQGPTGDVNENNNTNESTMGKLEDFAKSKLGNIFGGNKS